MSTTYYICRKQEHDRAEAITNYIERIRRTLHSYLDASLPSELKDDLQLTDDLEDVERFIWKHKPDSYFRGSTYERKK